MDTVVQDSFMMRRFARTMIQNDAGKCHMKTSTVIWPAKVVDRGVKMHIHWMNDSKPLEILDIFGELWMWIWRKRVETGVAPHGIKM